MQATQSTEPLKGLAEQLNSVNSESTKERLVHGAIVDYPTHHISQLLLKMDRIKIKCMLICCNDCLHKTLLKY